jgi:3-hydroxyisobutyrate dehydrogenase-like beta-hydroxyacid dehydrogenase
MIQFSPDQHRLGFIGIGHMGRRIAERSKTQALDLPATSAGAVSVSR